jgi:hypothetical protein
MLRLTADDVKNLNAVSGVAYSNSEVILAFWLHPSLHPSFDVDMNTSSIGNCKTENTVTKPRAPGRIQSRSELGMMCRGPVLDKFEKCLGLSNDLFRFGLCSHERMIVINNISFPSAGFKVIERTCGLPTIP